MIRNISNLGGKRIGTTSRYERKIFPRGRKRDTQNKEKNMDNKTEIIINRGSPFKIIVATKKI